MLRTRNTHLIALMIILINAGSVISQKNHYIFNQVSIDNGLSNNSVTCFFKDSRGFVWIGTIDGLNRYDGHNFKVFKHNPSNIYSISDNFISTIIEDFSGNLWIGTQGGGLNKYDPKNDVFSFYNYDSKNINSLPSNFIFHHNSMLIDSDSLIWIGTDNGLCSFNTKDEIFNRYSLRTNLTNQGEPKDVRVIYEDSENILWIGTNNGLIKFHKSKGVLKIYLNERGNTNSISSNIITAILKNSKTNELWIGTEEGLNLFNVVTGKFTRYINRKGDPGTISDNAITSIVKDAGSGIWIGTKSGGLNKYDIITGKFSCWIYSLTTSNGISDNYIDNLYFDNMGLLWIGTVNAGINILDIKEKKFALLRHDPGNINSLSYNTIRSIYEDRNKNIWIGTYGGGLNKFNLKTGVFTHFRHQPDNAHSLSHNIITALYQDESGNMWIGTMDGGLNIMKKDGKIYKNLYDLPDFIQDIYEDKNKNLWLGCNGGLYFFSKKENKTFRIDSETRKNARLTALSINKILMDNSNNLWVGTFNGLNKIIFKKTSGLEIDTIIHFLNNPSNVSSISDNRILSLYEDKKSNLWIGTYSGGLNKISPAIPDSFISYSEKEGLPGSIIYGILEDDNSNLWLSTNNGLSKFNPEKETFQNYNVDDGLQGNQFYWHAYYKCSNGNMYFGGTNGLNYFNPDSISTSKQFTPVVITDMLLFNKSVEINKRNNERSILKKSILYTDELVLERKDYAFSFEFASLLYKSQNKIKYAYQLENFDPGWIYTDAKKRYAAYSHLRPGEYLFKVKSTNEDGVWNDQYTSIKVKILPALWESIWAYIFYVIVLLLLLYFFRSQILTRARYRHELQLERIEREKSEEYNNMKLKFFTNVSHEFRTPLTLIVGPLENLLNTENIENKIKEQLVLIQNGSKRLLKLIDQLLEFQKVETGNIHLKVQQRDLISFLQEIAMLFKSKSAQNKIRYTLKFPVEKAVVWFDDNIIETIVYNLLSNAFKFTPENGKIQLTIEFCDSNDMIIVPDQEHEKYVVIKVSDTGIGIPKDKLEFIFTRFYQVQGSGDVRKGTGIGLALCKNLAELHKGQISVQSEVDYGTTFIVKIPVHNCFYNENDMKIENETANFNSYPVTFKNEPDVIELNNDFASISFKEPENGVPKILIIEDDIELVRYMGQLLEDNYKIICTNNGATGLEMVIEEAPDLIISDIMIPEMNGYELCTRIKTDIRISHIPVILLTALSSIENKIKGLSSGADEYISKPFHSKHLLVRVEKLIEQRKQLKMHFQKEFKIISDTSMLPKLDEKLLKRIMSFIEENLSNPALSVEELSSEIGMSSTHLYRKIKSLTGFSTNELIRKIRMKKAAQYLLSNKGTITQVMNDVGFTSNSYFAKCFQNEFGMLPKEFIAENKK